MRARLLLVPIVAAAALLAGCATAKPSVTPTPTPTTNGVDNLPADQILTKAIAALKAAKSFHAKGTGDADGKKADIDLVYVGSDIKGTITSEGATVELVLVGGQVYVKADAVFWKSFLPAEVQAIALPLVSGKYVKLPASQASDFPLTIDDMLKPDGTPTKGETTVVNGKPAITVVDGDNKLHVSLVGEPYPIDVVGKDGTLEFTDIGSAATITAPSAAETLDLSSFGH